MPRFRDRREAGRRLAETLGEKAFDEPVVLGIPRGGVVVASEIADGLGAPLDVVVVRKLGYPGHEEAGFGAVGEDGVIVPEPLDRMEPTHQAFDAFEQVIANKRAEVEERVARYRAGRARAELRGRSAIVVDDGIATGYTFAAALAIARRQDPSRLVAATAVASAEGASLVSSYCDEVVALGVSDPGLFFAVSLYYDDFPQVSDVDVVELLRSG